MQQRIRINHANQSHVGKVEALGDHLSPKQDLNLAMPEFLQCNIMAPPLLHRIAVHPQAFVFGESSADFRLKTFRTHPQRQQTRLATFRTDRRGIRTEITTVAECHGAFFMPGQCHITVRAFHTFAASATPEYGREPSHIQKEDDLPPRFQRGLHGGEHCPTDPGPFADRRIISSIHDDDWW